MPINSSDGAFRGALHSILRAFDAHRDNKAQFEMSTRVSFETLAEALAALDIQLGTELLWMSQTLRRLKLKRPEVDEIIAKLDELATPTVVQPPAPEAETRAAKCLYPEQRRGECRKNMDIPRWDWCAGCQAMAARESQPPPLPETPDKE